MSNVRAWAKVAYLKAGHQLLSYQRVFEVLTMSGKWDLGDRVLKVFNDFRFPCLHIGGVVVESEIAADGVLN